MFFVVKKMNIMEKKKYISPSIEWIPLDNEISLALESNPPIGPDEVFLRVSDSIYEDPFKSNNC